MEECPNPDQLANQMECLVGVEAIGVFTFAKIDQPVRHRVGNAESEPNRS